MNDIKFTIKLLRLSISALLSNPFRTVLTMLGIIIGSLTIIVVVALGEGAKQDIEQQYSSMSVTTILVNAPSTVEGARSKLSYDDINELKTIDSLQTVIPQLSGKVQMQFEGNSSNLSVLGTTSEVQELASLKLVSGNFWDDNIDSRSKVAVIGAIVAEELFGSRNADVVGKTIVVGKKEFVVIGLLEYKGGSVGPTTIDDSIFVPYDSAYRYILGVNGRFNINAQAKDVSRIGEAVDQIAVVLRESHNLKVGMNDDFRVRDMGSTVSSAVNSSRTMGILLASVGVIVLVVGGIGIMNIMYVTVTERTKEIGIRKAIGAKEEHILLQFIFEAFLMSFVGFLIGALLSFGVFFLFGQFNVASVMVWWSYLLSFMVTIGIGLFFGYYPAKKASALNPIDALRYE
ncbi:MAG: ABC transporter permease [Oligoflexia bacterium]|nr:ABC transporter permease [Oligoflexia bacterium]